MCKEPSVGNMVGGLAFGQPVTWGYSSFIRALLGGALVELYVEAGMLWFVVLPLSYWLQGATLLLCLEITRRAAKMKLPMISLSRLLCGFSTQGDLLRYGGRVDEEKRPIVVWNCTRRCNLRCVHCYASAGGDAQEQEMTTTAAKAFLQDLADFKVPVLLFSGGEPLLREDLFELAGYAKGLGIRTAISTNGTIVTPEVADMIAVVGFAEVGISVDGVRENNDRLRGREGAFDAAVEGIRRCVARGQRASLRFTISRSNYRDIPAVLDLVEAESVDRVCFYHLAYSGRGRTMVDEDLNHEDTRGVVELICQRTVEWHRRGLKKEVLMVGNHADGVYAYLKVKREQPERADEVMGLLRMNGGNNSGVRIAAVDSVGEVHADQFWWHYSFGNVSRRRFGDIWMDTSDPLMHGLKDRKGLLKGRCARCQYLDICNGNLRVRAEAVYGDVWAEDPACYLTDEEIGSKGNAEESGRQKLSPAYHPR